MPEQDWTPEPWAEFREVQTEEYDGLAYIDKPDYERARRCVTACAGIADPEEAIPALIEALEHYAHCTDGCTCGDGWSHKRAIEALALCGKEENNG